MADNRDAILVGVKAAHSLHRDLNTREQVERTAGAHVDVFGAVGRLGATLMFQKLDKLLGAFLPSEEPGILITTQRTLPIQRFTCAHEVGHLYLKHQPSFDDEGILRRSPFSTTTTVDRQEREADAFASMFLAPAWLVAAIVEKQKWSTSRLTDPIAVYQASLRLGTSYSATCFILERHRAISQGQREKLLEVEPKVIKQSLVRGYEPQDWRFDVWQLTDNDEGSFIEGGRNDLFVLKLRENSGAGYVWSFDELKNAGFAVVRDDVENDGPETVGGILTRRITAKSSAKISGDITLKEKRPWAPNRSLHEYRLHYDLRGPEAPGMWEPDLQRALHAA